MEYRVIVKNTDSAEIVIDAMSVGDAQDKAFEMFMDGMIDWHDSYLEFDVKEN